MERIERRLGKPDPVPAGAVSGAPALQSDTACACRGGAGVRRAPRPAGSGNGEAESVQEPTSDAPALDVSFEQLQKVWPGLFGSLRDVLGARRWAFFREAVAAAVEGNVIVLEVPHGFHLQSLQEDDAVAAIATGPGTFWWPGASEVRAEGGRRRRLRGSDHRHVPARGAARGVD